MSPRSAALCGACIGLLPGIAIAMILNLDMADAAYRITMLSVGGGWMGMLLAWLNDLLHPSQSPARAHTKNPS